MGCHCTPSIPHANTINLNGYSGHLHFNRTRRTKRHVKIFLCLSLPQPGNSAGISAPIICNEITVALKPYKGILEQIDFFEDYCTLHLLFPLNADLKSIFEKTIDECNLYGNFLQRNMIITNVKKLSEEEIKSILQKKK